MAATVMVPSSSRGRLSAASSRRHATLRRRVGTVRHRATASPAGRTADEHNAGPTPFVRPHPDIATAGVIDGKAVSETILDECRQAVARLIEEKGRAPELAVLIVGNRKVCSVWTVRKTVRSGARMTSSPLAATRV